MCQAPIRRPFIFAAGAALVIFLLLRSAVLVWLWQQPPAHDLGELLLLWTVESLATATLLAGIVAACGWWLTGARRMDREHSRVAHLAEVGLLAGGLAHEIRNTLNAMHSQLALLRKQLPVDTASQIIHRTDQIERGVGELDELITDFLAYARPAQDRLEEVDLVQLISEVLDFASLDLEQARVKVVTDLAASLPHVYADAGKLRRAMLNLIVNARQAMPDGGVLSIRVRRADEKTLTIDVCDTGVGIPQEDRARIFQAFFSTKPGGTGLGLAMVRRTIEDCGGKISCISNVGRGTTFQIHLPAAGSVRRLQTPKKLALESTA